MKKINMVKMAFLSTVLLLNFVRAEVTIGVSMAWFDDNFLSYLRESMTKEAQAQGVKIQFEDARGDIVRQQSQVDNFVAQKVSAIIVNPADTAATKNMTAQAHKAGIPLVYVNRKPEEKTLPEKVVFVGSDEVVAGKMQAEYVAKKLGGKGNVAIMLGELSSVGTLGRTAGVKEVLKNYPDIKIVEEQTANFLRNKAMDLMNSWMTTGKKIDAVIANNDEMAIGALMAMQQAGVAADSIIVTGVDATPDALTELKKGGLAMTVFQDAKGQGKMAVDAAIKLANKSTVEPIIWIPFVPVTGENYKEFSDK